MRWYSKITSNPGTYFEVLGDAIEHFYREYEEAKTELRPKTGGKIIDLSSHIPGMIEHRYGQLQELESILMYLNLQYDKVKGEKKRHYYEQYARQLSERLADQYADIESDVMVIREFIQQVALVRNLFLGISKGLEALHYQIGHIIQLRKAGIEDAVF